MSTQTYSDKFSIVLGETFDNISIIIGDLYTEGKTTLNPALVNALKAFILSHDKIFTINKFIENSNQIWPDIKNKNEDCLLKNFDHLFGDYSNREEFNAVKLIFTAAIDKEAKIYIWECLFSLVKLSINHIFTERGTLVNKGNKDGKKIITISYKNKDFFPKINLSDQNKLWDLKLW